MIFNVSPYFSAGEEYVSDIMRHADTVFRAFGKRYPGWKYQYKEELYNATEVNYIGVGLGFKHFYIPFHHYFVDLWNEDGIGGSNPSADLGGYGHPGTPGEHYWTDYGHDHYNGVVDSLIK